MGTECDFNVVLHHVENGGCLEKFIKATNECNPLDRENGRPRVVNVEACIKATAALRKCFGRNRRWFEHQYIVRMDYFLEEDVKPSRRRWRRRRVRGTGGGPA
ncbi:hypothetical protein ZWY2020_000046 [Hordeum vulgare]|nr:hypothetical protein ZWY2020_000046 [Hordeum vulgare]